MHFVGGHGQKPIDFQLCIFIFFCFSELLELNLKLKNDVVLQKQLTAQL